jgi:hypothetical protein
MRRRWPVVPSCVVLAATLLLSPGAARAQVSPGPYVFSPGWYVIPSLGLAEEYDSNVFGTSSNERSDFITRISPGVTFGYQSTPLTLLVSYGFGAEIYADNSDLNGVNRHNGSLDFRYLPNPRLTLGLGASFVQSESTSGQAIFLTAPPAAAAPSGPAPAPTAAPAATAAAPGAGAPAPISGVETGRRTTRQYTVAPSAGYRLDALTTVRGGYTFNRSEVEGSPTDNSHALTLSGERQFTPLDAGSVTYIFRYFDTEDDDTPDASNGTGDEVTNSHALLLGYSRRLTEFADVSVAAGPSISDQGDVGAEARASFGYRWRTVALALGYARTQDIVTGRQGAQTVDAVTGSLSWIITRELSASLAPGVSFISSDDATQGDTTVYAVTGALSYQINQWLSARATYVFTHQDERGSDDITRHVVTLGLVATYPYRIY